MIQQPLSYFRITPSSSSSNLKVMLSKVSWIGLAFLGLVSGFQIPSPPSSASSTVAVIPSINAPAGARRHSDYSIMELRSTSSKKGYEPKWKKKKTLADEMGKPKDLSEVGIKGTVSVVFRQGNETKTTMAMPGHLLRDVASQAGQFIKYGCGKGECGTCECLVNGQWIRPCSTMVPGDIPAGQDYVVQVKDVKNKAKSSGKFFSVRSFLAGFWNNLLGKCRRKSSLFRRICVSFSL